MTTNNVPTLNYTEAPVTAFPSKDVSSQGQAGITDKMVHTIEETINFGAGN